MKKNLLLLVLLLLFAGVTRAQVIADFESIPMNVMMGGTSDSSTMTVVPNPDPSGINTSNYVTQYVRDKDGIPWGGFWSALPTPVDVTVNKYVHVKVWKPRISPIKFKIEGGAAGNLEIASITPQTLIGAWEEVVFDFSTKTGTYPTIAFMPDFEDPLTLTSDIVIYFDDIIINNDPNPNTAAAEVIENYEIMPLNVMMGGATDSSYMTLVPNPDKSGINNSKYVVKYHRDKDGVPWGGFWSPTGVDVTTNKFVHVKVWKPRISPLKFKIQGGAAGDLEIASMSPQNSTGTWEDMVFNFSSKTGTYPTISFMPDFEDPLTLTEDIDLYFDDIILSSDSLPVKSVTLNVNMSYWTDLGIFHPGTDFVDVAGSFNGWDGINHHLSSADGEVYSIKVGNFVQGNSFEFKFRINGSWNDATCEFPSGGPNRVYNVGSGYNVLNTWYNFDSTSPVTFVVNMSIYHQMGIFNPATDFVDIAGNFNGWDGVNHHLATTDDSLYSITVDSLHFKRMLEFKFRINGSWNDATCEFPSGGPNRTYEVPAGPSTYSAYYNDITVGIQETELSKAIMMFPNPATDVLNVQLKAGVTEFIITNTLGQQVEAYSGLTNGNYSFDVSGLQNGVYLMTFKGLDNQQFTHKLIKR
jgi:hypothetical protein